MKSQLQITFRNMKSSALIEQWIQAETAKLETFFSQILVCRVAIEMLHRQRKAGKPLHVRIDLTLPGREIIIKHELVAGVRPSTIGEGDAVVKLQRMPPHHDLHVAIHDAFRVAARRIHGIARYRRGNARIRGQHPKAIVRRNRLEQGFSFLQSDDAGNRVPQTESAQ